MRLGASAALMMLASCFLAGCATTKPLRPPVEPEPYDFTLEGTFPPVPEVDAVPAGGAAVSSPESTVAGATTAAVPENVDDAPTPSHWGWRVQVFAGTSGEIAATLAEDLQSSLAQAVYVQFFEPYYKVRVGDCPTRDACLGLQQELRDRGWDSAWVVPSAILN